ncbi:MAG: protein-L-isoaspartate(D-aspartate) O-methyltransferase [Anaerolineae bacterium]
MTNLDPTYARRLMVERHVKPHGVFDERVLNALLQIPRHEFVSPRRHSLAYSNRPLSIGYGQTMLAPLVVAQMLQALRLDGTQDVLEVGTGSGYLTAILMQLASYVFSLERVPQLAEQASNRLQRLNYQNVDLHIGDGSQGLADMATFDVIVITASVPKIPRPLALQLHPLNGRMVIPVGDQRQQKLKLVRREANRWYAHTFATINLPALIGRYGTVPPSVNA